jgi:Leucine-rich repeat (LRR) protein
MVYNYDTGPRLDNNRRVNIARHLAQFSRLRVLLIREKVVDDAGMAYIGRLKRLESLYFWDATHITDAGAKHLRNMPRLEFIHLGSSQVGDEGLAALGKLPSLEVLSMQRNRITDVGLAHLAGHPKLKKLHIGTVEGVSPISDAGVLHLATIPNLEELDLQHTLVTPEGLKPLTKLSKLKSLILSGSTADNYAAVAPMFPNCSVDARKIPPPAPPTATTAAGRGD